MPTARDDPYERFRVEPWLDWLGGFTARRSRFWRGLGNLETRMLGEVLDGVTIRAPIFICGLARSGTTIMLECLAQHPDTATHCYRDYPGVLAPVLWDRIAKGLYGKKAAPAERAHGDGITVTPESPEAIEEMIWMAFHPESHDPSRDNRMERGDVTPVFGAFYRDHIRKLLWLRGGTRYLSKGNYNLARLGALIELFPDARFIILLRDPVSHIASLRRQHALFCAAEAKHPEALRYMQRVGHFEFGLDRRPLNLGHSEVTRMVQQLWSRDLEIEGWSLYWAAVHNFVADRLRADAALRKATLLVPFEALCGDPEGKLAQVLAHAGLAVDASWLRALAGRIRAPTDYSAAFEGRELDAIRSITAPAARRVGYGASPERRGEEVRAEG